MRPSTSSGSSNRTRPARRQTLFDIIESVDRSSLIDALEKEAARRGEPIAVLPRGQCGPRTPKGWLRTRAGIRSDGPSRAIALASNRKGLMTMAPLFADPRTPDPCSRDCVSARRSGTAFSVGRSLDAVDGHEQRLPCRRRGGSDDRPHRTRHFWRITCRTRRAGECRRRIPDGLLTAPLPFASVARVRQGSTGIAR